MMQWYDMVSVLRLSCSLCNWMIITKSTRSFLSNHLPIQLPLKFLEQYWAFETRCIAKILWDLIPQPNNPLLLFSRINAHSYCLKDKWKLCSLTVWSPKFVRQVLFWASEAVLHLSPFLFFCVFSSWEVHLRRGFHFRSAPFSFCASYVCACVSFWEKSSQSSSL